MGLQIEESRSTPVLSERPLLQVRARFDQSTVTVYQAYSAEIAAAAVAAQHFVSPFKMSRMTWIKPSFSWMMYRSHWAQRPGQERVLAIRIPRQKFDETLVGSCLSHYDETVYASRDAWLARKDSCTAIVQWDPERSISLERLAWRSIQIGLMIPTANAYASSWPKEILDVTPTVREIHKMVAQGRADLAESYAPEEQSYPLPAVAARALGASS